MEINFYKLQIGGNDLILVNQLNQAGIGTDLLPEIARTICQRNKGVGANAVVFIYKGIEHAVQIKLFNSSGSSDSISYDALLCTAKYVFDYGLVGKDYVVFESDYGVITLDCIDSTNFRISLGEPTSETGELLIETQGTDYSRQATIEGRSTVYTPVTLRHTGISVIFSNRQKDDKKAVADYFCNLIIDNPYRTVFVNVFNQEEISIETFSIGPYLDYCFLAGVAGISSILNGLCDRELTIFHQSDNLFFQWESANNQVYVTGHPDYVFSGIFFYDEESE